MTAKSENLVLEHLKRIQAEQVNSRERDAEMLNRLASIESGLARVTRDQSLTYSDVIQDRHAVDKLKERIERIEKRLDIADR